MGLIQREIEAQGVATVGVSIVRKFTEEIRPPRTVFVKWPLGHPLGEPFKKETQLAVIKSAFRALEAVKEPGAIIDLPLRWKRPEDISKLEQETSALFGTGRKD